MIHGPWYTERIDTWWQSTTTRHFPVFVLSSPTREVSTHPQRIPIPSGVVTIVPLFFLGLLYLPFFPLFFLCLSLLLIQFHFLNLKFFSFRRRLCVFHSPGVSFVVRSDERFVTSLQLSTSQRTLYSLNSSGGGGCTSRLKIYYQWFLIIE